MHLYLIRHGQSKGNVDQGFIAGRSDKNGLTPKGKSQITRTAWELRNTQFKAIYSSPVARAKESATILHNLLNAPLKELEFIQEMSYGEFEGEYFWVNMDKKRESFQRFNTEFDYAFPAGESLQMISDRVWNGWNDWLKTIDPNEKTNIIFVSHDAIISALLFCIIYGHPNAEHSTLSYKKAYMNFVHSVQVANGSVYVIDLHAKPVTFHLHTPAQDIQPNEENLCFYAEGMLGMKHPKVEEKITASENHVFHIRNSHHAIFKLLEEKEIVSSERIVSIYEYLKKKTSILSPEVVLYDKSGSYYKETVLIQDYVAGEDQSQLLMRHGCQRQVLELTKDLLEKIHTIPRSDVEEFWYPEDTWHKVHVPWHMYMSEEIDETLRSLSKSLPDMVVRNKVRMVLRRLKEYILKKNHAIVPLHGDFAPQNIVVTKDSQLRCLDFERARLGDGLWDYAYYCGWLERQDSNVATVWREMMLQKFSASEYEKFDFYTILFHAWTIRDTFDYKKNSLRSVRATKSQELLTQWAKKKE